MQVTLRKLHFILLICFMSTMTFNVNFFFSNAKFNNLFIILLAINTLVFFLISKEEKSKISKIIILFISFYIIHVFGLIRADNVSQAFFELEKKLTILLFPIILLYSPKLDRKQIRIVLLSFVGSCFLVGIFCLSTATYHWLANNDTTHFFYHDLSQLAGMHAIYLSMYFCFSIAILLFLYKDEVNGFSVRSKILFYFSLFIFAILILFLSGRLPIFLLIIGSITYMTILFYKRTNLIKSILGSVAIGIFIFSIALLFPTNRERFREAINYKGQYSIDKLWGGRALRELIWSCAFESIQTRPILGVGTGDVGDTLNDCYIAHDYTSLTFWDTVKFNAHNQYLETTVGQGLVGLLVLLVGYGVSIMHALKHQKGIYFIFILIFGVSCLTESFLERQNGIVFFAFFNSFLFLNDPTKKTSTNSANSMT